VMCLRLWECVQYTHGSINGAGCTCGKMITPQRVSFKM